MAQKQNVVFHEPFSALFWIKMRSIPQKLFSAQCMYLAIREGFVLTQDRCKEQFWKLLSSEFKIHKFMQIRVTYSAAEFQLFSLWDVLRWFILLFSRHWIVPRLSTADFTFTVKSGKQWRLRMVLCKEVEERFLELCHFSCVCCSRAANKTTKQRRLLVNWIIQISNVASALHMPVLNLTRSPAGNETRSKIPLTFLICTKRHNISLWVRQGISWFFLPRRKGVNLLIDQREKCKILSKTFCRIYQNSRGQPDRFLCNHRFGKWKLTRNQILQQPHHPIAPR